MFRYSDVGLYKLLSLTSRKRCHLKTDLTNRTFVEFDRGSRCMSIMIGMVKVIYALTKDLLKMEQVSI